MITLSKKHLHIWFIALALFCFPNISRAQLLVDVYGQGTFPQNQFKEKGYKNGLGFGFGLMSNPLNSRFIESPTFVNIHAGANFAFTGFGRKKYVLELEEPQSGLADVKISNVGFILTPTVRAVFGDGQVQPYLDAFAGFHFLSATQTIAPQNYNKSSEFEKETQTNIANSATYFAGLSAGMLFKLSESVFVNTGISYGWGGNSKYLPLNNIEQNGNELNFDFTKSRTDMLLIKVGFTFKAEANFDNDGRENNNSTPERTRTRSNNYEKPRGKSNQLKKNPEPKVGF